MVAIRVGLQENNRMMSSSSETGNNLHLRFRDESEFVPIATNMEELGAHIEARVKPGLDVLLGRAVMTDVEYAGYALPDYLHPHQKLDFLAPDFAEELKLALVGMDMHVASGPRPNHQDFYIEFSDAFDVHTIKHLYPSQWREGVYSTISEPDVGLDMFGTYWDSTFLLGPVVRLATPGRLKGADVYNQDDNVDFSLLHTVAFTGSVLMLALCEVQENIKDGSAIPSSLPARVLSETFNLQHRNTTWLDGIIAYEEKWAK